MGEFTPVGALAKATQLPTPSAANIERVLIGGDLGKLTEQERLSYYTSLCQSLGLNPLTQPFKYIPLNGKLTLYATKDAAEQLRKLHGVSIEKVEASKLEDVYVVTATARDRSGRADTSTGVVTIGTLKGDALANAIMKAETKAKRRVTLSICGLGMLDETELETIPQAREPLVVSAPKDIKALTEQALKERIIEPVEKAADRLYEADERDFIAEAKKDDAAPSVGPLYCMSVASSPLGKTIQADVTLSDGRIVYAKGEQMVSFMEQAAQSQMPLDVVTETRVVKKTGQSIEGIIDVRKWQSITEALEASVKAEAEQQQRTAVPVDEIPF
jgi:hypothetical protein